MVKYEIPMIFSSSGADYNSDNGSTFEVNMEPPLELPRGAKNPTLEAVESTVWWSIANVSAGVNDIFTIVISGAPYNVVIEEGLYDAETLSTALSRAFINLNIPGEYSFKLIPDEATSRINIQFNQGGMQADFTGVNTMKDILGFEAQVYPAIAKIGEYNELAPNIAKFNIIEYFLIHTDLVNQGIPYNGKYNQTVARVLIEAAPGDQIVSNPRNPIKSDASNLVGSRRSNIRLWLTDQSGNLINTFGEDWSVTFVLRYEM